MKYLSFFLFIFASLSIGFSESPDYAKQRCDGLEKNYRSLLGKISRIPLSERASWNHKIANAKKKWLEQCAFSGVEISKELTPKIKPLKQFSENNTPAWYKEKSKEEESHLRALPTVNPWFPNYGKSAKQKRIQNAVPHNILNTEVFTISSNIKEKSRNSALTVNPWLPNIEEQKQEKINRQVVSPTKKISFSVPDQWLNSSWWLWRKISPDKEWRRILVRSKYKKMIVDLVSNKTTCLYKFTPVLKHPGELRADYNFFIDTDYPNIQKFNLFKTRKNFNKAIWDITERNLIENGITISLLDKNKNILLVHSSNKKQGSLSIPFDLQLHVKSGLIQATDEAGNMSERSF